MKKLLLLCLLVFPNSFSFSQTPEWLWAKSAIGSGADVSKAVAIDNENNIIITGEFDSPFIVFGTDTLFTMVILIFLLLNTALKAMFLGQKMLVALPGTEVMVSQPIVRITYMLLAGLKARLLFSV